MKGMHEHTLEFRFVDSQNFVPSAEWKILIRTKNIVVDNLKKLQYINACTPILLSRTLHVQSAIPIDKEPILAWSVLYYACMLVNLQYTCNSACDYISWRIETFIGLQLKLYSNNSKWMLSLLFCNTCICVAWLLSLLMILVLDMLHVQISINFRY